MATAVVSMPDSVLEPGVYPGTPMDEYQAWPAASNSRLSKLRRSPAHLKAYLNAPPEQTPALIIGSAVHTAILEPDLFDGQYTVAQQCAAFKKDGARCQNGGSVLHAQLGWLCGVHTKGVPHDFATTKTVLSAEDYAACVSVRDSVYRHPSARALLAGDGEPEFSVAWRDADTDLMCKARLDRHCPSIAGGAIVDVKSTADASERAFAMSIFKYGYHRQGAFYLDAARVHGIPAEHFVIIAVEKDAPYAVAVYRLTEGAIDAGRDQLRPLLRRYAECTINNVWPAYHDEVRDISLPDWAWKQADQEINEAVA